MRTDHLQCNFLSGFEVRVGSSLAPIKGARCRQVLAYLALHSGTTVSIDRLSDALWQDSPPASARNSIQRFISDLRRDLGPARDRIESLGHGYRVELRAGDRCDVLELERVLPAARQALLDGRPGDTLTLIGAAPPRGSQPLAGLADAAFVVAEQGRLAELLADRSELEAEARLANNDPAAAIASALDGIDRSPYRERLCITLATALTRAGRANDALNMIAEFRSRLREELGLEPSPAVEQLELDVLLHRNAPYPKPELRSPATETRERTAPQPYGSSSAATRVLALPVDSFVGREDESASLHRLLDAHRLVTITGTGGIGKTRLAIHIGAERSNAHPGGMWIVDLAPVADDTEDTDAELVAAIASALGLYEGDGITRFARITRFLEPLDALLIVDNCEHVLTSSAAVIDALLSAAPGLRILATSRESLGVAGEHIERLAPLAAASELFFDRAGAVRAGFDDVDDAGHLVDEICDLLAGIPLAIELAAMQVRSMGLVELGERVGAATNVGRAKYGQAHHRSVDAAIAWSAETLDDDARCVFQRLSVFASGCEAAAVVAVCMPGQPVLVTSCLDQLVDRSLVETHPGPAGTLRFSLLEPIRKFAAAELDANGELPAAIEAHAQHYLDMSLDLAPATRGVGQQLALARLAADAHNIALARAALHSCGRLDDELDLCWNMFIGWRAGLAQQRGVDMILSALANNQPGHGAAVRDSFRVARAWYECAHLALDITMAASVDYAQHGIDIARSLGDPNLLARLLICQACAIQNATDRTDGLEIFAEGERLLAANPGPPWWDEQWEAAWFDMIRAAFGPRDKLARNRELTIRSAEAFDALGDHVHHVLALMVSAFWGIGTEHQAFVESSLDSGLESARRNHLGAMTGHVALYQAFIAISANDTQGATTLLAEARAHLGDLPPEVSAMIDPTAAEGEHPVEPAHASLAATAAGTASAIASTDDATAERLRRWAKDKTTKPEV